jgi:hypothetical protein
LSFEQRIDKMTSFVAMECKREINDRDWWRAPILAIGLGIVLSASSVHGAVYVSNGSAGELPNSAEVVAGLGALDSIRGTVSIVNGVSLGDIFRILISDAEEFSISTLLSQPGTNNFDTQIFLFDSSGHGIATNDDAADSAQSFLSSDASPLASLTEGIYYVLIEGAGRYPVDAAGNLIFTNLLAGADADGVYAANPGVGSFTALKGNSSEGGAYSLAFTGAEFIPIPEPASLALLSAALLLLIGTRRVRNRTSHE